MSKVKNKKVKSKVIEAHVLLDNPKGLMKIAIISNSIDAAVLDLQEIYPDRGIARQSVLSWKFLTEEEYKEIMSSKSWE